MASGDLDSDGQPLYNDPNAWNPGVEAKRKYDKAIEDYRAGLTTHAPPGHEDYRRKLFDVIMRGESPQAWQRPFVMQNPAKSGTSNFSILNAAMARIRKQSRGQSLLQGQRQSLLSAPEAPNAPSLLTGT